jgi:hypothetical protein
MLSTSFWYFVMTEYVIASTDYYLLLIGKVLLPTTDFGSELLSFHGTNSGKLLSCNSFGRTLLTQCLSPAASMS